MVREFVDYAGRLDRRPMRRFNLFAWIVIASVTAGLIFYVLWVTGFFYVPTTIDAVTADDWRGS